MDDDDDDDEDDDDDDMARFIGSYRSMTPPSRHDTGLHRMSTISDARSLGSISSHTAPSIYSEITGTARRGPEPRQPVKLVSRFSNSTLSTHKPLQDAPPIRKFNPFMR
jgi:hypothetical protein